jgi:hypothetical protein
MRETPPKSGTHSRGQGNAMAWKPEQGIEFGDKDSRANVLQLAIPAVNQIPSLLLHDMGAHLDQEQAARISRVFSFSNHKCVHDVE